MHRLTLTAALLAGFAPFATAVEDPIAAGADTYAHRCAHCHGTDAKGEGMIGQLFATKPSDLTTLTERNNGHFPFSEVYQSIDGRRGIVAHGSDIMPVWGEYFTAKAVEDPDISSEDAEHIVQGRILSLVYYLQSIQQ